MNQHAVDCPVARWDNLVIDDIGEDTLVYDQASHVIHQLNQTSTSVWRLCDGSTSVTSIARRSGLAVETVRSALTKLDDARLLAVPLHSNDRLPAQSRRSFMKKAGMVGAIPTVLSLSAPLASRASSTEPQPCGSPNNLCAAGQTCCGSQVCCLTDAQICYTSPTPYCGLSCGPNQGACGSSPTYPGECCGPGLICRNGECFSRGSN